MPFLYKISQEVVKHSPGRHNHLHTQNANQKSIKQSQNENLNNSLVSAKVINEEKVMFLYKICLYFILKDSEKLSILVLKT